MRGLSNQLKRAVAIGKAIPARLICIGFGISLLALGTWSARAPGASISASLQTGFQSDTLGTTGTFQLWAFSRQNRS
jgi:hypothetical protein